MMCSTISKSDFPMEVRLRYFNNTIGAVVYPVRSQAPKAPADPLAPLEICIALKPFTKKLTFCTNTTEVFSRHISKGRADQTSNGGGLRTSLEKSADYSYDSPGRNHDGKTHYAPYHYLSPLF